MLKDIEKQVLTKPLFETSFVLQIDEATDISREVQLLGFVCFGMIKVK